MGSRGLARHDRRPVRAVESCPTRSSAARRRRPTPARSSLPTNVVIDLTTWGYPRRDGADRQSVPGRRVINPYTGYVDILVNPNGTVVPTTIYSTPSSFGMSGAFFHFWLAERSDVVRAAVATRQRDQPALPADRQHQRSSSPSTPLYNGAAAQGRVPARDAVHPDRPDHDQRQRAVRQSACSHSQRDRRLQPELSVPGGPAGHQGRAQ